jgi:hypothetical protein
MKSYAMTEHYACRLNLARSTHRYKLRASERNDTLRQRLRELAENGHASGIDDYTPW